MPKPTSKSRQELRSRFVRNAIPTEADFADLIAASLNQADDGVLKLPDQPLGLVRQKPDQPVLRFFADPAAEGSAWQLQLGAGDKPGFGLAAADGKLALFVDGKTGNVGIGTTKPDFNLDVNGTVRLGGFTSEEKEEWPNIAWCRDLDKGWDEGLIKHGKKYGFFDRAGFGVHIHESRSFEMFSSGWRTLLGIEGGSGNTSIRGQTNILTGSNPILFSSSWTGFPDNKTNGAEICNDTGNYKTLMIVGNKSQGGVRRVSVWDSLEVNGTLKVTGKVDSQNARIQAIANDSIRITSDSWTDMPAMIVTAAIDGPTLVLFKTGGVQGAPGEKVRARFRLLIDNIEKAFTLHEFHNAGWELRDASLMWLESLGAGNHEFKVQWRAEAGTVSACWYKDLRSLIVIKL
jgi:hypothetical protein